MPLEVLTIRAANGSPILKQGRDSPAVYLDTCGLRAIAEDPRSASRFRTALSARKGCLVLSILSFVGLAEFSDTRHTRTVGALVDSLGCSLFFARFEPWDVIQRENEFLAELRRAGKSTRPRRHGALPAALRPPVGATTRLRGSAYSGAQPPTNSRTRLRASERPFDRVTGQSCEVGPSSSGRICAVRALRSELS